MKKTTPLSRLLYILIGLLLFTVLSCRNYNHNQNISVSVGAILPLTGDAAVLGNEVKEGMEIALDEINYSVKKYSVVFEDSKNDPKTAVSIFNKLNSSDSIHYFISSMSGVSSALIPLGDKTNSIIFATVTAKPNLTQAGNNVYRFYYTNDIQGETVVKYISTKLHLQKIVVVYSNDDYGVSGFDYLKEYAPKYECNIVGHEAIDKGTQTLTSQLSKLSRIKYDAIIIVAYGEPLINIIKKIRELKINSILFTYTGIANPEIINALGDAVNDIYLSIGDFNPFSPQNEIQKAFFNKVQLRFNKKPSHYHAFGYDLMKILSETVDNNSSNIDSIKSKLSNLHYNGILGKLNINSNREVIFNQKIVQIENETFIDKP